MVQSSVREKRGDLQIRDGKVLISWGQKMRQQDPNTHWTREGNIPKVNQGADKTNTFRQKL